MASDERTLATWLSGRDAAELAETLALRGVSPAAPWQDFFDAAEALLDASSVDRALTGLPRPLLVALVTDAAAPASASLQRRALAGEDGRPYAAVRARAEALRAADPAAFDPLAAAPDPEPSTPAQAAAAAERIFTTSGALTDVLLAARTAPLSRTGSGTVSAVDRKRLVEAGVVDDADQLELLVALAERAGLVVGGDRDWAVTEAASAWLESSTIDRWRIVARGFRTTLPVGVRDGDGWLPPRLWPDVHPLDADWPARAARLRRLAEAWGLIGPDGDEPAWARGLREGADPDVAALAEHLPAEIDRVYLQADLSAIAPGPLAPALDLRLRRMALRESRAQASTYRFSPASLTAGMTAGETAEGIRAFLAELSLTGIPQPLDYLITSTAERHGRVRVQTDAASGFTRVDSDEPGMIDAVAVDQALRPLGLVDEDGGLVTRVARDAVYWALADARYPVVVLGDDGAPASVHRRPSAGTPGDPSADPAGAYARLVGALRSGQRDAGDDAWLLRELEQAVRARSELVVAVRMPDGGERAFTLEVTGLGGGRLRGRDRAADIERTLPVSSIVSVRPAA